MKEEIFPRIYKFEEKYGEYYYLVNNKEQENKLWLYILSERMTNKCYEWMKKDVEYSKRYKDIKDCLKKDDSKVAKYILDDQRDSEYEGFHRITVETIK